MTWFKAPVHTNPGLEKKYPDPCGHSMKCDMPVGTSARALTSAPARPSALPLITSSAILNYPHKKKHCGCMLFGARLKTTKTNNNKMTWFKAPVHTNLGSFLPILDSGGHCMKLDMPVGTSARALTSAPARPSADH